MTITFTQDDVIRYIYKETTSAESVAIERALICNSALQEVHTEFLSTKHDLEKVLKGPSDHVVDRILGYSKSLNLHSTQ